MSGVAIKWARHQKLRSGVARCILMELAFRADKEGKCWPSQALLADETGYSKRSVEYALKALELWGLITRRKRGRNKDRGGRSSDLVTLVIGSSHGSDRPFPEGSIYSQTSAIKSARSYSQNSAINSEEELVADVCEGLIEVHPLGRKEALAREVTFTAVGVSNSSDCRELQGGHFAAAQATPIRIFRIPRKYLTAGANPARLCREPGAAS
jgi:DNA-binding transcriptional MocR family regulator